MFLGWGVPWVSGGPAESLLYEREAQGHRNQSIRTISMNFSRKIQVPGARVAVPRALLRRERGEDLRREHPGRAAAPVLLRPRQV